MARPKVRNPDEWHGHLVRNLKGMAESWSNLKNPAERVIELLKDRPVGSSLKVTQELLDRLNELEQVIARCPEVQDGPTSAVCLVPPPHPKPVRRSTTRKRRSA